MAEQQNASLHHKQQEVLADNQELKGKLIDLRGKMMDKAVLMNQLEGKQVASCSLAMPKINMHLTADLAGTRREASYSHKELSIERQQKSMLQSKVSSLEDQVGDQKREMKELRGEAKEKLTSAGDHVRQTRQEVANLKARVRV